MPTISQQKLDRLAALVAEFGSIVDELREPEVSVRPEVAALVTEMEQRRLCLSRTHKLEDGETTSRGMCGSDHSSAHAAKGKRVSEQHLIENGWWTREHKKAGRKPKVARAKVVTPFSSFTDEQIIRSLNTITKPMFFDSEPPTDVAKGEFRERLLRIIQDNFSEPSKSRRLKPGETTHLSQDHAKAKK